MPRREDRQAPPRPDTSALSYPDAPRTDDADTFHGISVADPYRWMDDPADSALPAWLERQAALARGFFDAGDAKARVDRVLRDLPGYVPDRLAVVRGGCRFSVEAGRNGPGRVLRAGSTDGRTSAFDPSGHGLDARLDPDFVYPSPTGGNVAVGLAEAGTDLHTVRIWDVAGNRLLPDALPELGNPVLAWLPDESGFYYNRTRAKLGHGDGVDGVYLHRLGTLAADDERVFDYRAGRGHAALPWLSPDGRYLFVKTLDFVTQKAGLLIRREGADSAFRVLFEDLQASVNVVGLAGDRLYVETRLDAPNGRLLEFDLAAGTPPRKRIAETDAPIARATHRVDSNLACVARETIAVTYLVDAQHRLRLFDLDGGFLREVDLPGPLTVLDLAPAHADDDEADARLRVATATFLEPYREWRVGLPGGQAEPVGGVAPVLDASAVRVTQRFYDSKDGTRIPFYLVGPREPAGVPAPVLMYGYGGWGSALTPSFRADLVAWVRLGGTFVIPNIRGGGEYGEAWHEAGRGLHKQTAFDDFCAAAGHLVEKGVTTPRRLGIRGLSNGGLLVTACANQRPELFAAAVAEVPLVDVVHLMDSEAGPAVAAELGDPAGDAAAFEAIRRYSPLQNVSAAERRPAMLVVPAEQDRRAPAGAAFKYVAALQATAAPGQVVLLRLVEGEGHTGWPADTARAVLSDELAFLLKTVEWPSQGREGS